MRVVIGKFSNEPFHALSKKDVSLIFKLVPNEWAINVSSVVLSSKIFNKSKLAKPVEYSVTSKQLSVFSRGLVREDVARQILLELARVGVELDESNTEVAAQLDTMVKPYMDKFLKVRM